MPLRDHFRPPLAERRSWEGFYGGWPAMIVIGLNRKLPERYVAEPQVHLGSAVATDLPDLDEYEVRVYDTESGRRLVAAVEIVSPANKDRPEHRRIFVAKCAGLLQNHVRVAIVDLVTSSTANLYGDLLAFFGQTNSFPVEAQSPLYAVSWRSKQRRSTLYLETWPQLLTLGQPLPTLPLWLSESLAVPLELEASYEETCRVLRIP